MVACGARQGSTYGFIKDTFDETQCQSTLSYTTLVVGAMPVCKLVMELLLGSWSLLSEERDLFGSEGGGIGKYVRIWIKEKV